MAIGRSRYAPPVSTKGHSVLKTRSYGLSSRAPISASYTPRSSAYSTRAEEYLLADRVSDVNYLSNALMDEGYNTALRSRGRDQALLKEATNAIVSSESYATPQTSVASRRVARGESLGRRATSVPPRNPARQEVVTTAPPSPPPAPRRPIVVIAPPSPSGQARAASVPPVVIFRDEPYGQRPTIPTMTREERRRILKGYSVSPRPAVSQYRPPYSPIHEVREPQLLPPTAGLKAHKVPRRFMTRTGLSLYGSHYGTGDKGHLPYVLPTPRHAPMRESLRDFPKVYVPPTQGQRPSNRSKAAIIASKMEPDPIKRRRPRSEYAANKYREIRKEQMESPTGGSAVSGGSERRRR